MRKITISNTRGDSVVLSESSSFFLSKVDGLSTPGIDIQTVKAPYQDGETYIDNKFNIRQISIEGAIKDARHEDISSKRRALIKILNPKTGLLTVKYEDNTTAREVKAIAEASPAFSDIQQSIFQKFLITLRCPSPFLIDPNKEGFILASFVGGFGFPLSFPVNFGTVGTKLTLENKGDVDTPVFIQLFGPMTNPVITNLTTGESITLAQALLEDETIEIFTGFGEKSVSKISGGIKTNAFYYISPVSKLFQLVPGDNEVTYVATGTNAKSNVIISYYNRYLGV